MRDRRDDIEARACMLATAMLRRMGSPLRPEDLLPRLLPALESHTWPGNVCKLENVLERVIALWGAMGSIEHEANLRAVLPELFTQ